MEKRILFSGQQQVSCENYDRPVVQAKQVGVTNLYSLMSVGTENIVFNRLFDKGTHWDNWVQYPFYPGYASIGRVESVGPEVNGLKEGDRVVLRAGHRSFHVADADACFPVDGEIDSKDAAWFALAKIAFMGVRAAELKLGASVLIIGAGPIGQMALRWVCAAGAEYAVVADVYGKRLEMAKKGGATAVIEKPVGEAMAEIMAACGGARPATVIDTTGNAAVFAHALSIVERKGRVVVLGDTGSPAEQRLTPDVVTRGITLVGAHDGHNDDRWNNKTITRLFLSLVERGRFSLEGLNTHFFAAQDCAKAYETANTRRGEVMGLLFDWTKN